MASIINTDTFSSLLNKVHATVTINKENLDFILSRKGQQVVLNYEYSLKIRTKITKERKSTYHSQKQLANNSHVKSEDELMKLSNNKNTKPVNDLIEAWKYKGDPLTAEKIAFDRFINLKIRKFDDLLRLNKDYMSLYEKYSRVLNDEPESVTALYVLLKNLEKVHVAIGEVHMQVLDARDPMEENVAVNERIKALSREFAALKGEIPNLNFVLIEEDDEILEFEDVRQLSCKNTLKHTSNVWIWNMKCFSVDDREYIACALNNGSITVWDLNSQTISFTLTGHKGDVNKLAVYEQGGVQMMASGSGDGTIKLWNLSNKSLVAIISEHTAPILFSTYKNDGKAFLVSGGNDKTINVWDLENNTTLMATFNGHTKYVISIETYTHDGIPYLVSCDGDGEIKIWNLSTHTFMTTLATNNHEVTSLAVVNHNDKIMFACGCHNGVVEVCDLENNSFTLLASSSTQEKMGGEICGLDFIYQGSQLCLLGRYLNSAVKCWNIEDRSIVSTFDCRNGYSLLTCEIQEKPCMVIGGRNGEIEIWWR